MAEDNEVDHVNIDQRLDRVEQAIQPSSEEFPLTLQLVGGDGEPEETIHYMIGTQGGVRELAKEMSQNVAVEKTESD